MRGAEKLPAAYIISENVSVYEQPVDSVVDFLAK